MRRTRFIRHAYSRVLTSIREHIYRRTQIDLTRPLFIRCIVTERCNYRCKYCFHWRQDKYKDEMTLNDWKRALVSLKDFIHPLIIQFVGGEPFTWRYFIELVEFCRDNDIDWGVITNGSALNPKVVKRIVAAKPFNIDISVDSANNNIHDEARGIVGSLDKIQAGVRLLLDERSRTGQAFLVRIKSTVHRLNVQGLDKLVDWTKQIGATSVDFSPVSIWREQERQSLWLNSPEEIQQLRASVNNLIERKALGQPIETSNDKLHQMISYFREERVEHGAKGCRAGLRDYLIVPNGDVKVCDCFGPIGNVKTNSSKEIWESPQAR